MGNSAITNQDVKYIIIQAGGKGTRMGRFCQNRPKCLVPVQGRTLLENTLKTFSGCRIIVIGNHLYEVLRKYVQAFCSDSSVTLLRTNELGTAGGLSQALNFIPKDQPFALTWSDLFFESAPEYSFDTELLIGLTDRFTCRWQYTDGQLINQSTNASGVAGFFVFRNQAKFKQLTTDKSLVRGFLRDEFTSTEISTFSLNCCFEVGEADQYEKLIESHRYFNQVQIQDGVVTKQCRIPAYESLIDDEVRWYQYVTGKFSGIPEVLSCSPLRLRQIQGKHAFDVVENRKQIIANYCHRLHELHALDQKPARAVDCHQVYTQKPLQRMQPLQSIIPGADRKHIRINGVWCDNPLKFVHEFEQSMSALPCKTFSVIHGDPTFSNTLIDDNHQVWFIDPRGRFGCSEIYGDTHYDWAKLYYSAQGNYDCINRKRFEVKLLGSDIQTSIDSQGYESWSGQILQESGMNELSMNLIHAGIWLSLAGYLREDLDAMMYAFYQGVYLWRSR